MIPFLILKEIMEPMDKDADPGYANWRYLSQSINNDEVQHGTGARLKWRNYDSGHSGPSVRGHQRPGWPSQADMSEIRRRLFAVEQRVCNAFTCNHMEDLQERINPGSKFRYVSTKFYSSHGAIGRVPLSIYMPYDQ